MASSADESRRDVETQIVKKPQAERPKDEKSDKPANPEFDHFEDLARRLLKVSKQELDEKRNGSA
jgi:hypothetical protein